MQTDIFSEVMFHRLLAALPRERRATRRANAQPAR